MQRCDSGWWQGIRDEIEPLWVGGLAVLQIITASRWLTVSGEAYEWAQYLLLGTLYPLLLLILAIIGRLLPRAPSGLRIPKLLLALSCTLFTALFFLWDLGYPLLLLWILQSVAALVFCFLVPPAS